MNQLLDEPHASEPTGLAETAAGAPPRAATGFPLSSWLALAGLLVLIATGGYVMFDRFFGGPSDRKDLVEIVPQRGRMPNFNQPRVRPDGVRERGSDRYQIKAGDALMDVSKSRAGEWVMRYSYDRGDMLNPRQQAAMNARFRLTTDAAFAKAVEATPEQLDQLRAIPARVGMALSEQDEALLRRRFEAYLAASPPRSAETEALLTALREAGNRNLQNTRQQIAERAQQIESILTPQQFQRFNRPAN